MDNTKLSDGCTANGKSFGSFSSNAYEITCVNENDEQVVMDQPTKLSSNGTSFVMIWKSAVPQQKKSSPMS